MTRLKILEVFNDSPSAIETAFDDWAKYKEFKSLSILRISEAKAPKIGVCLYIVYEENLDGNLTEAEKLAMSMAEDDTDTDEDEE